MDTRFVFGKFHLVDVGSFNLMLYYSGCMMPSFKYLLYMHIVAPCDLFMV